MKNHYLKLKLTFVIVLLCIGALQAQFTISGIIKDTKGELLIGATVLEQSTGKGASSNMDGEFSLQVSEGAMLLISYTGFQDQSIEVGEQRNFEIILQPESKILDDIVVIGYGSKQRKDIVESISSVGVERLKKRNATLPGEALQGEVSGVQVTTTGRPGDQATIRMRGYNSISLNNRPLILVDGVEVSRLFTVNPKDIESISVLKDAASQAIYGNRAANGVILITTKSGKFEKKSMSYSAQVGYQEATNQVEQLNAEQYVMLANEARANAGLSPLYDAGDVAFYTGKEGTNWQDEVLQRGLTQSHYLNFSNSSENANVSLSLGYMDEEGIYITTGFQRYNARLKAEFKATERLKVGTNMNFVYTEQNTGGDFYISRAFMMPPTVEVWEEDGRIGYDKANPSATNGILKNPVAMAELIRWRVPQNHAFGSFFADYEFFPGLNFKSTFRVDRRIEEKDYWEPSYTIGDPNALQVTQAAFADVADFKDLTWDWDNLITFKRLIDNKHSVTANLGSWARRHRNDFLLAKGFGFPPFVDILNAAGPDNRIVAGANSDYALLAVFGRAEYAYDNRYYFSGTLRRDGSSRFAPGNRWGTFYSVGLGWIASNEKFLKEVNWIDNLKLRASYGLLGNGTTVGTEYPYQSLVTFGLDYPFGGSVQNGGAPVNLVNENVTWEKTSQANIGIDLLLFKGVLEVTADVFSKTTDDLLIPLPLPGTSGASNAVIQNVGQMTNDGWELEVKVNKSIGKDFRFSVGGTLSYLKNEITDLEGLSFTTGREGNSHIFVEGSSFRSLYGYETNGIFQNEEQLNSLPHWQNAAPGDLIFVDQNNDGIISPLDRTILAPSIPKYTYGLNLNIDFKGFDVSALLQGIEGNSIMLANANFGGGRGFFNFHENLVIDRLNRWNGEGTSNTHPRLYWRSDPGNNDLNTDFFVEDGSYIRLKNLQIGYTFPAAWMERVKVKNLRIYVGGTNLWTKTEFTGFDPEIAAEASDSYGWNYPMNKRMLLGLDIDF